MCGIAGFCDFSKRSDFETLVKMTDALHHRGPDDSGYSFYKSEITNLGLGHRRLSILDLSAHGHQPMSFQDLEIIFNGEVYNFNEVAEELKKDGYVFDSYSDTEVLLKAYHKWGIKAVDKFNGMFSIVIYDKKYEKLILLRDRAGVKPFYYYSNDGLIMFASELKSFHEHQCFKKEIDLDSVARFLQLGYIPEPYSIFKNTFKLKAGHYAELNFKTQKLVVKKYWDAIDFYNMPKLDLSETEAILETEKLLQSAFEYRMVSDVPVGVFLSGGYDSSVVTALLQHERKERLKTFTIGFYEDKYNEAPYAKRVAEYLGTDHTEHYCSIKEALDIFPQLVEIYDEPFGDASAIPTILVSKIAESKVKVSLSADGGDEIFGGYGKYLSNLERQSRIISKFKFLGDKNINKIASFIQGKGLTKDIFFENKIAKLSFENSIELQKLIPYFSTPISNERLIKGYKYQRVKSNFDDIFKLNSTLDSFDKMFAIDYKTYMSDDILHKVDRATMSVGLEGREPLLDYRIIEFVSRLPSGVKIKNGNTKWLLKQVAYRYLPKEIMDRPKMGFGIPVNEWLKNDLRDYVEEYLSEKYDDIFYGKELERIKKLFFADRLNYAFIWNIVIFQMWYKRWMIK
ncbi:asparagine synthase (glutamine-hydrolyzing) [Francisella sp. LA112445]|uniref:asparagine synthase (glutamine-hydrolyzing) n=1 Tax=Francisella sp. LA112445 TaxID=1395624 RepID=UPI001788B152|nr:asparagine synthase (glutamine-hydrolyzing) [Francisella sp. LA112445]QIW09667.1 asparagine synthase (glutamine-hydrolyzing) [Francisella sp. LA112445]